MRIFQLLLLLFLLVPLLEIYLLIKVGGTIGAIPTIFLVVFTAVLGAFLVRQQGISTFRRAKLGLARGELPTIPMLEGVVLLVCGALLLTPGFFTDALGFLGLVPALRRGFIHSLLNYGIVQVAGRRSPRHGPRTIEGEYRREDDEDKRR